MWGALGMFASHCFHFIRIPLEKDDQDEEYNSDDGEEARAAWRTHCRDWAGAVRRGEMAARTTLLLFLMFWLCWEAQRWHEFLVLVLVFVGDSITAAVVSASVEAHLAGCTESNRAVSSAADEPERTPGPEKSLAPPTSSNGRAAALDAARLTHALFDVQGGEERWVRTATVKRSTATISKTRLRRGRKGRPQVAQDARQRQQGGAFTSGQGAGSMDSFQKFLADSGVFDVSHRLLLLLHLLTFFTILLLMASLTHLGLAFGGSSSLSFYDALGPADLFRAYGGPGTLARGTAVGLELAFLCLASERLHSMATLPVVGTLALVQRIRALRAVYKQIPLVGPGARFTAVEARQRLESFVSASRAATELSALRWQVLRTPLLGLYAIVLCMLGLALALHLIALLGFFSDAPAFAKGRSVKVFAYVGLSLTGPLASVLLVVALANAEIRIQQVRLWHEAQTAMEVRPTVPPAPPAATALALAAVRTEAPVSEEVAAMSALGAAEADTAQVLSRARSVLSSELLRWPGGWVPGLTEPSFLLLLALAALTCVR